MRNLTNPKETRNTVSVDMHTSSNPMVGGPERIQTNTIGEHAQGRTS